MYIYQVPPCAGSSMMRMQDRIGQGLSDLIERGGGKKGKKKKNNIGLNSAKKKSTRSLPSSSKVWIAFAGSGMAFLR
jgi:hypothetical protein